MDTKTDTDKNLNQPNDVESLISQLERLLSVKNPLIKSIRRPKVLISALRQLNELIEMETFKSNIIETIHGLMINSYYKKNSNKKNKFDNQMLHFCNYGDPGTGKTRASKILAKIFYGMGIDYGNESLEVSESKDNQDDFYNNKLGEITNSLIDLKQQSALAINEYKILKEAYAKKQVVSSNMKNDILSRKESLINRNEISANSIRNGENNNNNFSTRSESSQDKLTMSWKELSACLNSINEAIENACSSASEMGDELNNKNDKNNKQGIDELNDLDDDPNVPESVYCIVCGRNELVAKFAGQTAGLAYDFLMANRFKTIIIEEAYDLYNSDRDGYGAESLVQINRFMDEHPDWVILGFNGYREKLEDTIFHVQPGLRSRITKFFHMTHYTSKGLSQIFKLQVESIDLKLDSSLEINQFFSNNISQFSAFGRDTFRFAHLTKRVYSSLLFNDVFTAVINNSNKEIDFIIRKDILDLCLIRYKESSFKSSNEENDDDN